MKGRPAPRMPIAAASAPGVVRRVSRAASPAARATSLELRLAAALLAALTEFEPLIVRWFAAALAAAGGLGPGPLAGAGGRDDGPAAYTISEAAARARLSRSATYAAVRTGSLKIHKHGARSLVLPNDLSAFLTALPTLEARPPVAPKTNRADAPQATAVKRPIGRGGRP